MEMGQAISLSTNDNSLGKQTQAIRRDAELTQKQLAEKVGLSDGSIVRFYESGQSNPSLEILQKIAAACGYRHENVFKKNAMNKMISLSCWTIDIKQTQKYKPLSAGTKASLTIPVQVLKLSLK